MHDLHIQNAYRYFAFCGEQGGREVHLKFFRPGIPETDINKQNDKERYMDFEDLFNEKRNRKNRHQSYDRHPRKYHDHDNENNYYDEDPMLNRHRHETDEDYHHRHDKLQNILSLLHSHPHKNALIAGALILGIIILTICLFIIWLMFPLIMKGVYYVEKNGIQGIADFLLQSLGKIWKGNG
jgi:hypothetical protein